MARVVEDGGCVAVISKPAQVPIYEPQRLPDPITCAGSIIGINERGNNELPRLAYACGGSWHRLAYLGESTVITQQNPVTVDVTPLVQQAVRDMLPALVPRPQPQALPAPMALPSDDERIKVMAQAMLEMSEQIARLQHAVNDHSRVIDGALIPVPAGAAA